MVRDEPGRSWRSPKIWILILKAVVAPLTLYMTFPESHNVFLDLGVFFQSWVRYSSLLYVFFLTPTRVSGPEESCTSLVLKGCWVTALAQRWFSASVQGLSSPAWWWWVVISYNLLLLLPTHPLPWVRRLRSPYLFILNRATPLFTEIRLLWEEAKWQNPDHLVGRELELCFTLPLLSVPFKPLLTSTHSHKQTKKPLFLELAFLSRLPGMCDGYFTASHQPSLTVWFSCFTHHM